MAPENSLEVNAHSPPETIQAARARLDEFLGAPVAPIKSGMLTTEFYGKCAVQLIAALVLFGAIPAGDEEQARQVSLGLITALEAFYTVARAIVKQAHHRPA